MNFKQFCGLDYDRSFNIITVLIFFVCFVANCGGNCSNNVQPKTSNTFDNALNSLISVLSNVNVINPKKEETERQPFDWLKAILLPKTTTDNEPLGNVGNDLYGVEEHSNETEGIKTQSFDSLENNVSLKTTSETQPFDWFGNIFSPETTTIGNALGHILGNNLFDFEENASKVWNNCDRDMAAFRNSIYEMWMLEVLDSIGKPPAGILRWNLFWPGDYDQCLSVEIPQSEIFSPGVKTKYCLMKVDSSLHQFNFESGICVPSTCNEKSLDFYTDNFRDIIGYVPYVGKKVDKNTKFEFECFSYDERTLDSKAIICIVFVCLFGLTCVIATSYNTYLDYLDDDKTVDANRDFTYLKMEGKNIDRVLSGNEKTGGECQKSVNEKLALTLNDEPVEPTFGDYLLCFSIWKNTTMILSYEKEPFTRFYCLYGLKVFTMAWVILCQTYYYLGTKGYAANLRDMLAYSGTWHAQVILRGDHAVDTFLVISGFLLTFHYIKSEASRSLWNIGYLYLRRYLRLTPIYYMTVFFYACVFPYLGDGPYWRTITKNVANCDQYWWYNLLYINNFQPDSSQTICLRPSWYLSLEMQFVIIAPIFLMFLKCKRRYIGLALITTLLIICWITTAVISYQNDLNISMYGLKEPFNSTLSQEREDEVFNQVLIRPYTRIGAFLIGTLLGFFVTRLKGAKGFLPMWMALTVWTLVMIINLAIIYGLFDTELGAVSKAFYNSFSHTVWSITVAWIILACVTEHGGPVNYILSWPIWIPMARLTYGAFLGHTMVLELFYGYMRVPTYFTNTTMTFHFLGYFSLSYGFAFLLHILVEMPFSKIQKLIFTEINTD